MGKFASVRNIEELSQYGKALSNCGESLKATYSGLMHETNRVCDGWDDNKAIRFIDELKNHATELNKLADTMKEFSVYIEKSCEILRNYDNLHL